MFSKGEQKKAKKGAKTKHRLILTCLKSSHVRNNLIQFDLILVKTDTNQTFFFRRNRKKTTWRTQLTGTVDLRARKLAI